MKEDTAKNGANEHNELVYPGMKSLMVMFFHMPILKNFAFFHLSLNMIVQFFEIPIASQVIETRW